MSETVTFSKASFVKLLDSLYPNPDDAGDPNNPFGPYGPIGPVVRAWWVMLNPQPLPPVAGLWRAGPHPEPWRAAFLARAAIDRVVEQYRMAELLAGADGSQGMLEQVRGGILELVDEFCGNRPPRWPRPKGVLDPSSPTDLLVMGAEFQKAAAFDNPLQADFAAAADQLFETGLRQLESG